MVDIDEILAAAIRTASGGPGSRSHYHVEVEALEREGIIITPSRAIPEVRTSSGGSIPIEELNASNDD